MLDHSIVGLILDIIGSALLVYASLSHSWCRTEYPDDPKKRIHHHYVWSPYYISTGGENKGKLIISWKHKTIRASRFTPQQVKHLSGFSLLILGFILQIWGKV